MGRVVPAVRVVRTVLRQRSQVNQEDPGVREVQGDQADLQQSPPVNQGGQENQVAPVAPEDPVVQEVQEVLVAQGVQKVLNPQHHDRVYQPRSQRLESQDHQEGPEVLEAPEDQAVRVDRVCHILC